MVQYCSVLGSRAPLILFFLSTMGCGDNSHVGDSIVQGTVTVDGSLAPRGQVTFYPEVKGPVATGPIHSDGSFSLRIGQGNMTNPDESKIFSGNYSATVIVSDPANKNSSVAEGGPPLAGNRLSSVIYTKPETSGLEFSVKAGRNVFAIELEGSKHDPPSEEILVDKNAGDSQKSAGLEVDDLNSGEQANLKTQDSQPKARLEENSKVDSSLEDSKK